MPLASRYWCNRATHRWPAFWNKEQLAPACQLLSGPKQLAIAWVGVSNVLNLGRQKPSGSSPYVSDRWRQSPAEKISAFIST